uniref:Oxysterol-binding protein n=1 Tax=Macrostomum lignano TaxID=282301 RepID=A0A1I8FXJ8_9PLAT
MDTDFDNSLAEMQNLTQFEKQQLKLVMQQAKKFEKEEELLCLRKRIEGNLLKFTNVVKGYQPRWVVLNSEAGLLEYYEKEEHRGLKRRGELPLTFAIVTPSEEDSQTFSVNANTGEVFKLRANDAKERQYWVTRIRAVAEFCSDQCKQLGSFNPASLPDIYGCQSCDQALQDQQQQQQQQGLHQKSQSADHSEQPMEQSDRLAPVANRKVSKSHSSGNVSYFPAPVAYQTSGAGSRPPGAGDASAPSLRELSVSLGAAFSGLESLIYSLPGGKPAATEAAEQQSRQLACLDRDVLVAKATALAAIRSLESCRESLTTARLKLNPCSLAVDESSDMLHLSASDLPVLQHLRAASSLTAGSGVRSNNNDQKSLSATNLPAVASSSSTSVSPQLSAPGPLSSVPLPEMLEAPLFPVPHADDEEDGPAELESDLGSVEEHKSVILHLLQQLKLGMDLTRVVLPWRSAPYWRVRISFIRNLPDDSAGVVSELYAGRKGAIAKKPYNPLIGETFHCSWLLGDGSTQLVYTAEQVSHHPPVTAFYLECPQKQIWLNASIYTKSKFMGMSIGVNMIGKLQLHLLGHGEVYSIQLPSAYARSILTVPWVELGDKVSISCAKSRFSASVIFHTKPFYGGKLHRISAEVRSPAGGVACRVNGEWSGQLEFENPATGERRQLHVAQLPALPKRVRPRHQQRAYESRRLWESLEDRQRNCERYRRDHGLQFPVKYFIKDEEGGWIFKQPLQSGQATTVA